jgi:hypothetical protein
MILCATDLWVHVVEPAGGVGVEAIRVVIAHGRTKGAN